jgi:UDP-N-acetylglucosamine transferase subunit ALG13
MGKYAQILPKGFIWRKHILILVTLGTRAFQFDRLLLKLDKLCAEGIIDDDLVVQSVSSGLTYRHFTPEHYLSTELMHHYMSKSSLIITHGGTGSITDALKLGKKVIGVPRLSKYQEHIDDHQVELIRFFRNQNYIIGIDDVEELEDAIQKSKSFQPAKFESGNKKIKAIIRNFLDNL